MEETVTSGEPITFSPIGYVVRPGPLPEEGDVTAQLRAQPVCIEVDPRYAAALLGMMPGDDIVVLTYLHRATRDVLQVHPRGDPARPLTGVFATRSPARPNPIGLTVARVLDVRGAQLTVVGLDALHGTPVLDIKCYSAFFDAPYRAS